MWHRHHIADTFNNTRGRIVATLREADSNIDRVIATRYACSTPNSHHQYVSTRRLSEGVFQSFRRKTLHDLACRLGGNLDLLAEGHALSRLACRLVTKLDHGNTWDRELASALK